MNFEEPKSKSSRRPCLLIVGAGREDLDVIWAAAETLYRDRTWFAAAVIAVPPGILLTSQKIVLGNTCAFTITKERRLLRAALPGRFNDVKNVRSLSNAICTTHPWDRHTGRLCPGGRLGTGTTTEMIVLDEALISAGATSLPVERADPETSPTGPRAQLTVGGASSIAPPRALSAASGVLATAVHDQPRASPTARSALSATSAAPDVTASISADAAVVGRDEMRALITGPTGATLQLWLSDQQLAGLVGRFTEAPAITTAAVADEGTQFTIYALKLRGGRYYVGKTTPNRLETRLREHAEGRGSVFTRVHAPVETLFTKANRSGFDEDAETLRLMDRYGVDNVRGGRFATAELSAATRQQIAHCIRAAKDRCYRCGGSHFIGDCVRNR